MISGVNSGRSNNPKGRRLTNQIQRRFDDSADMAAQADAKKFPRHDRAKKLMSGKIIYLWEGGYIEKILAQNRLMNS